MRRTPAVLGAFAALAVLAACVAPPGTELPLCDPPSVDAQVLVVTPGGADRQVIPILCWQQAGHERIRLRFELPPGPECHRLDGMVVAESGDAIAIVLTVSRDEPGGACPSEPGVVSTEVDLLSPVGSRRVLDAGRQD